MEKKGIGFSKFQVWKVLKKRKDSKKTLFALFCFLKYKK